MRIRTLDVGVESITQWQEEDEVHLPKDGALQQLFLPQARPLDSVLRRPSLDERLPALLARTTLDPELLNPATMSETRLQMREFFARRAETEQKSGPRNIYAATAALLGNDAALDQEVRAALAVLLRG
jgi:hypothetical protein